jgi:hypothetical protein
MAWSVAYVGMSANGPARLVRHMVVSEFRAFSAAGGPGEGAGCAWRIPVTVGAIFGPTRTSRPDPVPVAAAARQRGLRPVRASTTGPSRHDGAGQAPQANRVDGTSTRS